MRHCIVNAPIVSWHKNGTRPPNRPRTYNFLLLVHTRCLLFTFFLLLSACLLFFSPGGYFHERCISYGILPNDEAEHIWQKLQERKRRLKMGGGDLTPPPAAKKKSKGVKSSKAIKEEGYDPELQISAGDAIGRASL